MKTGKEATGYVLGILTGHQMQETDRLVTELKRLGVKISADGSSIIMSSFSQTNFLVPRHKYDEEEEKKEK